MERQKQTIVLLDKRWLAILSIAVIGMSIDQVTTSYAVTINTASESNLFLQHIFRTFPQPFHLLFYAVFQATIVMWSIMLLWSSSPKHVSSKQAMVISSIIASLPFLAGINNIIFLLS